MNEIETNIQMLTGDQIWEPVFSSGAEIIENTTNQLSDSLPELSVNVQQLGSWNDVVGTLAQWLPFLDKYSDLELFVCAAIIFLWILCVIWVLRDASARSENVFYQLFSALLIVFLTPIFGLPLYLAFRPLVYRWEKTLWREALEQNVVVCPHCQNLNNSSHVMCSWCGEPLQTECKQCHCKYQGHFAYCPECWAPNIE